MSAEELLENQRISHVKQNWQLSGSIYAQDLEKLMSARLAVLSPLFGQLETVDAGIGDVSKVAARELCQGLVTQTDIVHYPLKIV